MAVQEPHRIVRSSWLRSCLLVLAAVLLHLSSHTAPWSASASREVLPEDGPAFVRNTALDPAGGLAGGLGRAWTDPATAWEAGQDTVGRARWRPASTTLFVLERAAPWASTDEAAAAGAAWISLLLHVLVVLGAARLVTCLGGSPLAATAAGLLTAASPVALSAAAWPARQAVVLAAALALGGTLVALRGGSFRLLAGGALLAAAGLAHEAAFGFVLAVPLLRRDKPLAGWPVAVAPILAFAARWAFLGGLGLPAGFAAATSLRGPNLLDGVTGILVAAASFVLPVRMHFADGPFVFSFAGHAAALVLLLGALAWLQRRRGEAAPAAALAAFGALTPALFVGAVGAAPYQDAYQYMALPLLAASAALFVAPLAAGGGPARLAAVSAAATLLGASVAATIQRAPSFRTRDGLVALAVTEMPSSLVVRSWDLAVRASGAPDAVERVAPEVRRLADDASGAGAARLRADAVSAVTVSKFLMDYASRVTASSLPGWSPVYDAAGEAAVAATELRPQYWRAWTTLAAHDRKTGNLRRAYEAANRAGSLAMDNPGVLMAGAEIALAVGNSRAAAEVMDRAFALESERAKAAGQEPGAEFLMLYARVLAADGAWRVPDPASDMGLRYRFDLAAELIVRLRARGQGRDAPDLETRRLLYDIYLRYGDLLTQLDRTVMALLAYQEAVRLTGTSDKSVALEHGKWLQARLEAEELEAKRAIVDAQAGKGELSVVDALVRLYVALCRQGRKNAEADELFEKLVKDLGGLPARLRMHRAVQRHASLETPEDQSMALRELEQVIVEEPNLARAHFELARVLEWQGTVEKLRRAQREYERAAELCLSAPEEWMIDATQRAEQIQRFLALPAPK